MNKFETLSLVQLKDLAKALGKKSTSIMRKAELVEYLTEMEKANARIPDSDLNKDKSAGEKNEEGAEPVKKKRGRPRKVREEAPEEAKQEEKQENAAESGNPEPRAEEKPAAFVRKTTVVKQVEPPASIAEQAKASAQTPAAEQRPVQPQNAYTEQSQMRQQVRYDNRTQYNNRYQNYQNQYQHQNQANYQNQYRSYDPSDHTAEFDPRDIADNKLFAVFPYFTFIYGLIIALLCRESAFTKFHAKNAIRLKIAAVLALIPAIIPILGWFISLILYLILAVIHIVAIVNCFQGKAKDLPIVGNIGFLR